MPAPLADPSLASSPATPASALAAQSLRFAYADGRVVFDGVSLQVREREIVCLLGGSGCGKSTLLRVLAGLESPQHGEVRCFGEPLTRPHPRAALVFQQASLLPWLNLADNVGFGLDFAQQPQLDRATRTQRIQTAISAVGLAGQERRYPEQLSGGMAQRVALARALAREPQLLLADEPFSALDALTRGEMQTLLVELAQRWHTAALLVTHDIDEALCVADRIVLLGAPAPGHAAHVRQEWTLDPERPRRAHTPHMTALRHDILAALQTERRAA